MDTATLLLGTIFVVLTVSMTIAGGYAYTIHRKLEARRKR